jgi:hypothetical protein
MRHGWLGRLSASRPDSRVGLAAALADVIGATPPERVGTTVPRPFRCNPREVSDGALFTPRLWEPECFMGTSSQNSENARTVPVG